MNNSGNHRSRGSGFKKGSNKSMVVAVILIATLAMGAVAAISFSGSSSLALQKKNDGPEKVTDFGELNSAHVHAAFIIKLNGKVLDFAQQKYQVKSPFIHVENDVGTTLHRHSTLVPFGEFLRSINMDITNNCFVLDNGTNYCSNGVNTLRIFINENEVSSISDYIIQDGDRILIIYGNVDDAQLNKEFQHLKLITIKP